MLSVTNNKGFKSANPTFEQNVEHNKNIDIIDDSQIDNEDEAHKNDTMKKKPNQKINKFYNHFLSNQYFLKKNKKKICIGDLLILYDNLTTILKRNVSYSKYLINNNDLLLDRINTMEQRNKILSRELQDVSSKWKKHGKMDISRYYLRDSFILKKF